MHGCANQITAWPRHESTLDERRKKHVATAALQHTGSAALQHMGTTKRKRGISSQCPQVWPGQVAGQGACQTGVAPD